jgi:hypothetical protein
MIKRFVYTLFILAAAFSVRAQSNKIVYDFGDKEASFNPNPGASSTTFLPKSTSAKSLRARVRTSSDGTGEFNLVKKGADFIKGAGLEIVAGSSTSKFSLYNAGSFAVAKTSFNIKFDDSAAGQWVFANGVSENSDDLFQGNSGIRETSNEVFVGLRWNLSPANEMNFYTRNGLKWAAVKSFQFSKNTTYLIEIYSNNAAGEKKYLKDGENSLKPGTYHVWVNGKKTPVDFVSGGLDAGKALNALLVYGVKAKGTEDTAKAWIDNFEIGEGL